MAYLMSNDDLSRPVSEMMVLKGQDGHQCVMRVGLLPRQLGYQMIANGCSMRRLLCRRAMRWSI